VEEDLGEGCSTTYKQTNFHVFDSTPDGAEYTVEHVKDVRKIYKHKVFNDRYLYFVKVTISHPEEDMLDQVVYPLGVQVTVNYDADSPFMVSSSFA